MQLEKKKKASVGGEKGHSGRPRLTWKNNTVSYLIESNEYLRHTCCVSPKNYVIITTEFVSIT